MLLEKIVILGKLKILSKHHTSYDVLSDHLTDKGSLITSDLLSDNEQLETANCEIQELYTSRQDDANKLNELHCRHYRNNEEIRLLREFISDNDLDSPTFDELLRMYQSDYDALPY